MNKQVEKVGKKVSFTYLVLLLIHLLKVVNQGKIFGQRFDHKTIESLFKSFVYFHLL